MKNNEKQIFSAYCPVQPRAGGPVVREGLGGGGRAGDASAAGTPWGERGGPGRAGEWVGPRRRVPRPRACHDTQTGTNSDRPGQGHVGNW